jgi:hypothetical protein
MDALLLLGKAAALSDEIDAKEAAARALRAELAAVKADLAAALAPRRCAVAFDMSDGTQEVFEGECQASLRPGKWVVYFDDGDFQLVDDAELVRAPPPKRAAKNAAKAAAKTGIRKRVAERYAYVPAAAHKCSQPGCGLASTHTGLCRATLPRRTRGGAAWW